MLKKFTPYFLLLMIIGFSSCAKIGYIGQSHNPTEKIDVYITEQSINKPFQYMGKGYLVAKMGFTSPEKVQRMAEDLGKKKGADAVLITNYLSPNTAGSTITTTKNVDSTAFGIVQTASTTVSPSVVSNFNILFIKYNQ